MLQPLKDGDASALLLIYDAVRDILSLTARALHKYMQFESTVHQLVRDAKLTREKMWRVKQSNPDRLASVDLQIFRFSPDRTQRHSRKNYHTCTPAARI